MPFAALAVAAVMVAACAGGAPSAAPTGSVTGSPSATPPMPSPTAISTEEHVPSAWENVTAGLGPEGEPTMEAALRAFELVLGDLPAVERPTGDGPIPTSGSAALNWIALFYDDITDAQRAAVDAAIAASAEEVDLPLPAELAVAASSPKDPLAGLTAAIGPVGPGGHLTFSLPDLDGEMSCTSDGAYVNASSEAGSKYERLVAEELWKVEQHLGMTLGIPVYVTTGKIEGPYAWASAQSTDCNDLATSCHVRIFPNNVIGLEPNEYRRIIAHELMHCLQARILPVRQAQERGAWLTEGFADFVAQDLYPGGVRDHFTTYLATPAVSLFDRSYDALGFYMRVKTSGGNPWQTFVTAYRAPRAGAAFNAIVDSSRSKFEDQWASGYALDPSRGAPWDDPEAPASASTTLHNTRIENGGYFVIGGPPLTNHLSYLELASDLVRTSLDGDAHGRIYWEGIGDAFLTSLEDGFFCTLPDGCVCPGGGGPTGATAIPTNTALVAISAINTPSSLAIEGLSIDQFCHPEMSGTARPSVTPTIDPCLVGTWRTDPFVIPGPEPEMDLEGGENAVVSIDADGTVDWNFDQMEPNVGELKLGRDSVAVAVATGGQASGTATAVDGAWTLSSIDKSGVAGQMTMGFVQKPIAGGASPFVMMLNGEYTCESSTLIYTTIDPVEDEPVVVSFAKL